MELARVRPLPHLSVRVAFLGACHRCEHNTSSQVRAVTQAPGSGKDGLRGFGKGGGDGEDVPKPALPPRISLRRPRLLGLAERVSQSY